MYKIQVNGSAPYEVEEINGSSASVRINQKEYEVNICRLDERRLSLIIGTESFVAELVETGETGKAMSLKVNNRLYKIELQDSLDQMLKSLGMDAGATAKVNQVKAPMPGLVLELRVSEGQQVSKGDPLLVLEAMKMENIIKSPADAVVSKIHVQKSAAVEKNQVLISFA